LGLIFIFRPIIVFFSVEESRTVFLEPAGLIKQYLFRQTKGTGSASFFLPEAGAGIKKLLIHYTALLIINA
jgi:hypothetical protein